jgi:hypothetical protein
MFYVKEAIQYSNKPIIEVKMIKRSFKMNKILVFLFIFFSFSVFYFPETSVIDMIPGRNFIIDKQGNIFSDSNSHTIRKISPEGKLLLCMGRDGEGPSDIKRLGWFAINPVDSLIYVTEFTGGNKWISKFSTDGKYVGEWKCELDIKKYAGLSTIRFDNKGNGVIQTVRNFTKPFKGINVGSVENTLIKLSPAGKKINEFYKFNFDFYADVPGKGNITIPFGNYLFWTIWNDKIIIREQNDNQILVYSSNGTLEKRIPLPFQREKVTSEDLDDWENYLRTESDMKDAVKSGECDLKFWRKNIPFPDYKPVSGDTMFVDSHGNLFSRKYLGYKGLGAKESIWAKIDLNTGKNTIIKFDAAYRLIYIWRNYFFFKYEDEDENVVIKKIDEKELFKTK